MMVSRDLSLSCSFHCTEDMFSGPKFSLSNIRVRLTAKGLFRNLQLPSGYKKSTVVFQTVEKAKQKPSPRSPRTQTRTLTDIHTTDAKIGSESFKAKCEKQTKFIQELKQLLSAGNQKLEAITVVVQYFLAQREEALKQRQALSQELASLRKDLVATVSNCEKQEEEKEELKTGYECMLQKLQEQHQAQLSELDDKYQQYYTHEFEKLQHACKEETARFRSKLQEKVDVLNCTHEKVKQELETSHVEQLNNIKDQYEADLAELRASYETEKKTLEESYAEEQTSLEKKIQELNEVNTSLKEKLKAEEELRKSFTEKSNQKNPQLVYLEQELESLKAVLEIKNEKLHEQDKKMMFMDKLVENNTALEEKVKRLQQENEDLKARMDKHVALSRQLSTEQAVLQESLSKESKVNKRLSMENEELLWKLHNGDICSPRKLSPTSPPMTMQSPRNSSSLSSPTVSPR
ncbi:microtubule-associated tumor suppressor 1 isoform X3 [Protopterus annectens]|uniref:microtubule-associated tumor suppressor 1 isoform X3 n=1 Tax=Protopterus annectens TaxID=7888 RepID=UPI001CF9F6DA|nr:microtubule-associated tumor suppressor 1 isoform X3 [Protopterus annectens]